MSKAYQVSDGEYSYIVYGDTAGQAKAQGSNEFGIDFISVEARRAKWADEYVDQPSIPKELYLKNGWWWECHCGTPRYEEDAIVINDVVYCDKCKPENK